MPIYEYVCSKCQKAFEFLHLKKDEKAECPECKSQKVIKQVSKSDFVLKGVGWAKDRYGR